MSIIWAGIVSASATYLFVRGALKFFPAWGLLDRPEKYGLIRARVPYSVGLIFFAVTLLVAIFFIQKSAIIYGVLTAGSLVVLVSFLDDRYGVSPWIRLIVQIFAGVLLVFAGVKIQLISNPFGGAPFALDAVAVNFVGHEFWLLSALGIIAWVVVMMNVMNWLDGIPGLASGISTIAFTSLFILSIQQYHIVDQSAVKILSLGLAIASLVFLAFDFSPPKILMGDSGSMFLGFMLAALSIIAGGKFATALLIMGFALFDAVWVVIARVLRHQSPLRGDLTHFHHRLLRAGLPERKALVLNYAVCAVFAAISLLLHNATQKAFAFIGVLITMVVVGIWMVHSESRRRNLGE